MTRRTKDNEIKKLEALSGKIALEKTWQEFYTNHPIDTETKQYVKNLSSRIAQGRRRIHDGL